MKSTGCEPPFFRAIDKTAFETNQWKGRAAIALVTNELREILFNLRDDKPEIPHPNLWSLLGGGCEDNEDPHQAVLREVYEEAELYVEKAEPLCRVVDLDGSQGLITVFRIETTARLADLQLHEGQELRFFSLSQTHEISVVPLVRDILNQFLITI